MGALVSDMMKVMEIMKLACNSSRSNSSMGSMEVDLSMYCAEEVIPLRGDGSDPFQYWQIKKPLMAQTGSNCHQIPEHSTRLSVFREAVFKCWSN
jgi:hypothetical protein